MRFKEFARNEPAGPDERRSRTLGRSRRQAAQGTCSWEGAECEHAQLPGSVHAISGIAESGDNVAHFVQSLVHRRGHDRHIRMRVRHALNAFRRGQQAKEPDIGGARILDERDCRSRAVPCCKHGIHHKDPRSESASGSLQ